MSSLCVLLEATCLDSGQKECEKLVIESWESKSVNDVKYLIQDKMNIPVCDQNFFYGGNPLIEDSSSLKCLYLREGDKIGVEYLAKADINEMKILLTDLKKFAEEVRHRDENLFEVSRFTDFSTFPNYDIGVYSMENLAFEYFIPWKTSKTVAQRHYFVQEGSFEDFMDIFKFSMLRYKLVTTKKSQDVQEECVDDNEWENNNSDLEAQIEYFNNEQMVLQMHCLSMLWNFSETSETRQIALQHGGLQLVCDALLLDPNDNSEDNDAFWATVSINETAVGSLVQYAEFSETQDILANNNAIISKLIYMVECRLHRETSFYPLYSSQISANTLFCCACNTDSPIAFVKRGVHIRVMELTTKLLDQDHDMALRYYCCLFLARIVCCPKVELGSEITSQIDGLLSAFLREHSPKDISGWEEKHNYVWVSLVPFVSLAFAQGVRHGSLDSTCVQAETNLKDSTWPGTPQTRKIGIFCVEHLLRLKENCQLLLNQKLLPYLTCLKWQLERPLKTTLEKVLETFSADMKCPPTLAVIARSQLAMIVGFEAVLCM